ncbi:MAG: hypothetical protein DMG97_03305 [Acidobacteria bacterium]|nr:MAG: hypothetical protein DMG96_34230 [Acidobacteriota bacterium]PYV76759.1 MAG: hypothetical protein DMG97_03305 [Acidobacteriota bacterium]
MSPSSRSLDWVRSKFTAVVCTTTVFAAPMCLLCLVLAIAFLTISATATTKLTVTGTMPAAYVGTEFRAELKATGGPSPYQFSLKQTLPPGLALNSNTGVISGTPKTVGSYAFSIQVSDQPYSGSGDHVFTIVVSGPTNVQISIWPTSATITSGGTQQFTAKIEGTSNTAVTWSVSAGSISSSGFFTAPNVTTNQNVSVNATRLANASSTATALVSVTAPPSGPPVPPPPPPPGPGPSAADNRYCNPGDAPNFGGSDGPAALPATCFYTATQGTPSPGNVIQVPAGASVQTALNTASCGDTLVLQAGQSYAGFSLDAKNCDAGHYITLRSSALSSLPPEGTRATPCYAGVSFLPGRPALNCSSIGNVMAKIAGVAIQSKIISNATGANYYRLIGLEIADTGANGATGGYYDLVLLKAADHIILDRCWIHGTAIGEDVKGVGFESSTYIAVIDSYISDIHSKISGYGADSSAVGSVTGIGPVKIVNNFLEAAGATILWGGGYSATNITDVELRRNHVFKPFTWWQQSSSYFGTAFVVKNLFENKMGIRELVEANIFENSWAQAQRGTAILFYPKNQYGGCPGCTVQNITFRYNLVTHAVNAISISNTPATTCAPGATSPCLYYSGPINHFSIHDNVLDDINATTYSPGQCCSDGFLFGVNTFEPSSVDWPHDILINHNTGFPTGSGTANIIIQGPPQVFTNFVFSNNVLGAGSYGFHQTLPGGGLPGCGTIAGSGTVGLLNGCMGSTWTFTNNVLAVTSGSVSNQPYPPGNYLTTWSSVGLASYNNGQNGNYQLSSASPYKNAGTDGKDLGADISGLLTATAGVK